ncbi:MAG: YcxB family protein [Planctomycetota bacterium]|jgi:hypothetical protein
MNEITCSGSLTYEETVEAQDVIWRTPKKPVMVGLIVAGLCALALLVLTLFVRFFPSLATDLNRGHPVKPLPVPMSFCIATLIFVALYPLLLMWTRHRGRKAFQEDKFLRSPSTYTLTQEAFVAEGEYGTSRILWTDFVRWRETPRLFLFYQTKWRAMVLPKRFLQDAEQEQLKAWLSEVNMANQAKPGQVSSEGTPPDAASD